MSKIDPPKKWGEARCCIEFICIEYEYYYTVACVYGLSRCNYLRKIKSFREAGYDIVYMDETRVNQNHCTDYMWLPNDGSD
jgi:hypothetical protein